MADGGADAAGMDVIAAPSTLRVELASPRLEAGIPI
jgi:hypothetical protein